MTAREARDPAERRAGRRRRVWLALAALGVCACQSPPPAAEPAAAPVCPPPDRSALDRATERSEQLERELQRLRADLREAEGALVAIESGMRGKHTRADAVSALAESQILVERAARRAPWAGEALADAREKLDEADRHIQAGHFGSAVFFTSRARRMARTLVDEAARLAALPGARFVSGERVNLRAGPSTGHAVLAALPRATPVVVEARRGRWTRVHTPTGQVGWVFAALLSAGAPAAPAP